MKTYVMTIPTTELTKRELLFRLRNRSHGKRWQFGIEVGTRSGYEHYQVRYECSNDDYSRERNYWTGIACELQEAGGWSEYECKDGNFYSYVDDYMGEYRFRKLKAVQLHIRAHGRKQTDRNITIVCDKIGGTIGKTFFARWSCLNGEAEYIDGTNTNTIGRNVYDIVETKGFARRYTFIIDVTRSERFTSGMWAGIETIKNGFVSDDRYAFRSGWIYPPRIFVLANHEPDWEKLSKDRWDKIFVKLEGNKVVVWDRDKNGNARTTEF